MADYCCVCGEYVVTGGGMIIFAFHKFVRFLRCCWLCYWLLPGWLVLLGISGAAATPLTIGSINNEPVRETRRFAPVVRYLADQLAPQGITKGRVVIAATMQEMAKFLKEGQVDFYLDSPMPSMVVNHLAGSSMMVRRWKKGVAEYHSVLFVKKESPINTLSQLPGKKVGFEDPYSSSGHLLPRIAMVRAGLQLLELPSFRSTVPTGKVGFTFNSDDENTMVRVLMGKLDVGAMSLINFKYFARGEVGKLRIIHETFSIPRHIVNVRSGLPANLKKALRKALLEMEYQEDGQTILTYFQRTTRFDDIPIKTQTLLQQITPTVLDIMGIGP